LVSIEAMSIVADAEEPAGSGAMTNDLSKHENRPRTLLTIRWRTLKPISL
jgi:hypothetical protein